MPLILDPVLSGYNLSVINDNFEKIESTWDEKLDRLSNTQANQLEQDLDANSNKVINVADGVDDPDAVNVGQVKSFLANASVSGGSIISDTAPTNVVAGTRWNNCATNKSYLWTGAEWVEDNPSMGGVSLLTAPNGTVWLVAVDNAGNLTTEQQ